MTNAPLPRAASGLRMLAASFSLALLAASPVLAQGGGGGGGGGGGAGGGGAAGGAAGGTGGSASGTTSGTGTAGTAARVHA
jgi:hypothetical protein